MRRVTALAPATVANVAVGFDLLGFPVEGVGDEITLSRMDRRTVEIEPAGEVPTDPKKNTASVGLLRLIEDFDLPFGFHVALRKGIPLSSGMGGSAASAVAAIVAANAFLKTPLPPEKQLHYALLGEAVASGAAHADNAAPCLLGGLILTLVSEPLEYVSLPVPRGILCVLVHPHLRVDTKTARGILRREISLSEYVSQSARLAGFIAACYRDDLSLLKRSLTDLIIEPQRAKLVPGFAEAKAEALQAGALGCSLSGSGPSVFAWTDSAKSADRIAGAMVAACEKAGHSADRWISPVSPSGARILSQE